MVHRGGERGWFQLSDEGQNCRREQALCGMRQSLGLLVSFAKYIAIGFCDATSGNRKSFADVRELIPPAK